MAFERFYITEVGQEYLAKAQTGKRLVFTKVVIGKGKLPSGTTVTNIKQVVEPVNTLALYELTTKNNQTTISVQFTNRTSSGILPSFLWYECALFAKIEGDATAPEAIYAYANAMDDIHADYITGVLTEFQFHMILTTNNANNITIVIDESLVYATPEDLEKKLDKTEFTAENIIDILNGGTSSGGLNADTVDGKHANDFAPVSHTHAVATTNAAGFMSANDKKKLNESAPSIHTHMIADVTGLQGELDGLAPKVHTHTIANVTGLQGELDGFALKSHNHTMANVTGLQGELDNLEQKIDAFESKAGLIQYTKYEDLGLTATATYEEIFNAMKYPSIAVLPKNTNISQPETPIKPTSSGMLVITKHSSYRSEWRFLYSAGNNIVREFLSSYDNNITPKWTGWKEISLEGHTHNYLPLSGGVLSGNLAFAKDGRNNTVLSVLTSSSNGLSMGLEAYQSLMLFAGESKNTVLENVNPDSTECISLVADQNINFYTNLQNKDWAAKKEFVMDNAGNFKAPKIYENGKALSDMYAPKTHSHTIANVTGLQDELNGFAPKVHTHTITNVTGLQAKLDGLAAKSHTHAIATETAAGFMSAADKKKLNELSIPVITIETVPTQKGSLTYTGSAQSPSWNGYDSSKMVIGGKTSSTDAGNYTATFTPKANHQWSDGTTAAKSVSWSIAKAAGSLTLNKSSLSLNIAEYSGTVTATRAGNGAISATSSNTNIATVSVSGTTITVLAKAAGTATITVKCAAGTNHTAPANKTIAVTVSMPTAKLEENSWTRISEASVAGKAKSYWSVGDEKKIVINNETLTLVILGFDHDDLASGGKKAGITFGLKNLMQGVRPWDSDSASTGFLQSDLYKWMQDTLLPDLPSDLRSLIKLVHKKTAVGNGSTDVNTNSMSLFLFSGTEVGAASYTPGGEGSQYAYFSTAASRTKYLSNGTGNASGWWLRSPMGRQSTDTCIVSSSGISDHAAPYTFQGICFGFCV